MAEYFGNICTCRRCNGIIHTIKRGDTLYLLARQYNITVNDIMRANANMNIYNLQIGDQICIPVRRPEPSPFPRPNRPGQGTRPPQLQPGAPVPPVRPGQPTPIQPRDNDDVRDDIEDLLDELIDTSAESMSEAEAMETSAVEISAMETSVPCCGGMKVRDVIANEEMTLEELAKMLKNM